MIRKTLRLAFQTAMSMYISHKLKQLDEAVTKTQVLEAQCQDLTRRMAALERQRGITLGPDGRPLQ